MISFWLCWFFIATRTFSLVVKIRGHSLEVAHRSHCGGFLCGARAVYSTWPSAVAAPRLSGTGLVAVVRGLSCSVVRGIFLDQGLNPCLLHWQVGSLPLSHQRSPLCSSLISCSLWENAVTNMVDLFATGSTQIQWMS